MSTPTTALTPANNSPVIDSPEVVFEEILDTFKTAIVNQPRNLQERIGPSGLGEPCSRALIAELFNLPTPPEPPNLKAWVGTQIHKGLEEIFGGSRWLTELRVNVGTVGGVDITGNCDMYDSATVLVNDWKTKSKTQMQNHRRNGPGPKYRVQGHLYGLGVTRLGHRVRNIMFVFIPRDGEFADIFHHAEPYDEQVALDALARANQLHALATLLGPELAMQQYQPCDDEWCRRCRSHGALLARPGHGSPLRHPGQPWTGLEGLIPA